MSKRLWVSNSMGHEWALNDHGSVDAMAMWSGDHNGPRCVRCGYTFCEHCQDMPSHRCSKEHDAIKESV